MCIRDRLDGARLDLLLVMTLFVVQGDDLIDLVADAEDGVPVSYTHLDVYKRQPYNNTVEVSDSAVKYVRAQFDNAIHELENCLLYTSRCV